MTRLVKLPYTEFQNMEGTNRNLNKDRAKLLSEDIKKSKLILPVSIAKNPLNEKYILLDGQHRLEAAKILREEAPGNELFINIDAQIADDFSEQLYAVRDNPPRMEELISDKIRTLNKNNKGWTSKELFEKNVQILDDDLQNKVKEFSNGLNCPYTVVLTCLAGKKVENEDLRNDPFQNAEFYRDVENSLRSDKELVDRIIRKVRHICGNGSHPLKGFTLFFVEQKQNFDLTKFEEMMLLLRVFNSFRLKLVKLGVDGRQTEITKPGDTASGAWKKLFSDIYSNIGDYRVFER